MDLGEGREREEDRENSPSLPFSSLLSPPSLPSDSFVSSLCCVFLFLLPVCLLLTLQLPHSTCDDRIPLLLMDHDLEALEIIQVRPLLLTLQLPRPGSLLPLSEDVILLQSLQDGLLTSTTTDLRHERSQGEIPDGLGPADDTGVRAMDQSLFQEAGEGKKKTFLRIHSSHQTSSLSIVLSKSLSNQQPITSDHRQISQSINRSSTQRHTESIPN